MTTNQRDADGPAAQQTQQIANGENNGDTATAAVHFIPTLFELELIARHWLNTRIAIDLIYFLYQQTGSTESQLDGLAEERMEKIREALGEEHYANFAAEVDRQLSKANSAPSSERRDSYKVEQPWDTEFPDDREGLGHCYDPQANIATGYVDEVNGIHGALSAGFEPTPLELTVITKHWLITHLDTVYHCHRVKQSTSTEWRLILYSDRRLAKLRRALGDERYLSVSAEVDAEFEQRFGDEEGRDFRMSENMNQLR